MPFIMSLMLHLKRNISRSYINECIQIHDGHIESIIVDRFLHVSNDQHDIHLQFGRQISPIHSTVQTIGHACKAIRTDFPKITVNEKIGQRQCGYTYSKEYVGIEIMDLLE